MEVNEITTEQIAQGNTPVDTEVLTSPAETTTPEAQATSTDDHDDLAQFQTELEGAKTPEEKAQARKGYQTRQAAKELKASEKARELEHELQIERARREVYERVATQPQQQVAPQEPQGPQLPPAPKLSDFKKVDEFGDMVPDMDAFGQAVTEYSLNTIRIETQWQNQQNQQRENFQKVQTFLERIQTTHPDFQELSRLAAPTPEVGKLLTNLDAQKPEVAVKVAYYLAKNNKELNRLNAMPIEQAAFAMGELAAKISTATPEPKTTTKTEPPIAPLSPSSTKTEVVINNASDYIAEMDRQQFGG